MDVILQPATPDMAPVASTLIHLTMGHMADYLFGAGDAQKAREVLERLFRATRNYFSHQFAVAATSSGEVTGLLIGYSPRLSNSLDLPTAYQVLSAMGISDFIGFLARARPLFGVKESEDDEYFIAHVAVLPAHQGHGVGTRLLSHAEQLAKAEGFNKVSLTVEALNDRAISLYLRTGFNIVGTVKVEALHRRIGYEGFHRMRKVLA